MPINQAIIEIVARQTISDQRALLALLAAQGFAVTQSTLSRHLKKLHIEKRDGIYQKTDPPRAALPPCTVTEAPPNLLVVRTTPGFAQAIALLIDQSGVAEAAGTVAGDDTVFVAAVAPDRLGALHTALLDLLSRQ